ncbi:hypothetical protein MW290_04850 [Aquincola tertiaricarbonis]|uniref:Uncharacterized protein n=1 Tax=Aquincola tertiaricarbonis TaxID=391953 RepID=A0ABY4S7Q9_AQUTE|nr:hypothetical protein [Aquincola tertiaricarbonis]URI07917.1 hypothetical protein MW290_04850 [Aquincola tertiaricarbonis]
MHDDASPRTPVRVLILRALFLSVVASLLVTGIIGGLLRAGVAVPLPAHSAWPGQAVLAHAFLMICAFMGTVIGIERAIAVKARAAFAAPVLSALAGVSMLAGAPMVAGWLAVLASLGFIAVNVTVVSRQKAAHTLLLLTGATAWLVGNLLLALGSQAAAVVPWWFSFLVLTIAAERLEMTRLMRRRSGAAAALYVCLGLMLAGSAVFAVSPVWGGWLYGLSLAGLALWLVSFDIARRTISSHGLSRYMAVCLLLGYAWLAVAGIAWIATSLGYSARVAALHALGLGFIFSMMLGHAPVILPALARVKLLFGWFFYVPLALLHSSLALRLFFGPFDFALLGAGAAGNAAAIAVFAATMVASVLAWRARHPAPHRKRHAVPAPH